MSRTVGGGVFFVLLLATAGCGAKLVKVNGVVTLDGQPVEGATVSFVSQDGKAYTGFTDAAGNFSLASGDKEGAQPGDYKVTVVKARQVQGGEGMNPSSPEYLKHMKKEEGKYAEKSSKGPVGMPGMPGMPPGKGMMPPGMMPPGMKMPQGEKAKTELPDVYASGQTTPLTAKVVPDGPPIQIELKSKP